MYVHAIIILIRATLVACIRQASSSTGFCEILDACAIYYNYKSQLHQLQTYSFCVLIRYQDLD